MMISIISSWSWRFLSSETLSSTVVLFWFWCDDDKRLWSKSSEIFFCLLQSPFSYVTTWQDDRSKFSWLSKSPTCSGSNSRRCREIWSCSKRTELGMVSSAGGTAWFEERLGSWKYCKLGTGTFTSTWDKLFSICVILDIIFSRFSWKVGVSDKSSGAICVISACCWFTAILETGTVYLIRTAVLWTGTCSVIAAKGISTRLLLSNVENSIYSFGTCLLYRTHITANIWKNLTHFSLSKSVAVPLAKNLRMKNQGILERRPISYKYLSWWPESERGKIIRTMAVHRKKVGCFFIVCMRKRANKQ